MDFSKYSQKERDTVNRYLFLVEARPCSYMLRYENEWNEKTKAGIRKEKRKFRKIKRKARKTYNSPFYTDEHALLRYAREQLRKIYLSLR